MSVLRRLDNCVDEEGDQRMGRAQVHLDLTLLPIVLSQETGSVCQEMLNSADLSELKRLRRVIQSKHCE